MQTSSMGANKYGMPTLQVVSNAQTGLDNAITPTVSKAYGLLDHENPMLWLVGIGAITLGLAAASTHIRVGPVTASASIG